MSEKNNKLKNTQYVKRKSSNCGIAYQNKPSVSSKATNSGITLVALVVTIVVLLILAGVTITYVLGDHGIFKLAGEAKNKTENAMEKEQEDLDKLYSSIKVAENSTVTLTMKQLNQYIEDKLEEKIEELKQINSSTPMMDFENAIDISSYTSEDNKFTCPKNGVLLLSFHSESDGTKSCFVTISGFPDIQGLKTYYPNANILLNDNQWGIYSNMSCLVNRGQTVHFSFEDSPSTLQAYFVPFK